MRVIKKLEARRKARRDLRQRKLTAHDRVVHAIGSDQATRDAALDHFNEVDASSTEPLADLLTAAIEQMEKISLVAGVRGVAGEMPEVAEYLRELVEHGQELAYRVGSVIQDAPLQVRMHNSFGEAEVYMTHTQELLSVAITTTSEASMHLRRIHLAQSR